MDNTYWSLSTAALGDSRSVDLERNIYPSGCDSEVLVGPAAGDTGTLVYSYVQRRCEYVEDEPVWTVEHAGLKLVRGRTATRLPGVPATAHVAAARGRIAVAPAVPASDWPLFAPAANGTVEIRNASSGSLIASFRPAGTVRALALSASMAAVLVVDATGRKRIDRYVFGTTGPGASSRVGSTQVSSATVAELDLAAKWIVYRVGRRIRLLDGFSGRSRHLATAGAPPIGLSIEGRRIAWAVNRANRGRVQAIQLPRHTTTPG